MIFAILIGASVFAAGEVARQRAAAELARTTHASAALHAAALRSELLKHRSMPFVLAKDSDVVATLRDPAPDRIAALNRKLEVLSAGTGAVVIYLLNSEGVTIAASNWRESTSFVGVDYSFRPYFRDAKRAGIAEMFALGASSHRPGLYMSRRVDGVEGALGVLVVKAEFEQFEKDWSAANPTFAADRGGTILITSITAWRFRAVHQLDRSEIEQGRFKTAPGKPEFLEFEPSFPSHPAAQMAAVALPGKAKERFMVAGAELGVGGWTVFTLAPVSRALGVAAAAAQAITLLVMLSLCGAGAIVARRRRDASLKAARQEAARAELEARVQERTAKLRSANRRLMGEMEERRRAEAHIQRMQDQLVQSNKLAALGQIAAGVAHEINQPLAAIRSYADNATVFLKRREIEPAAGNLRVIAGLTDRIGLITNELRAFARKSNAPVAPVQVSEAVDGALLLLRARITQQGVQLIRCEGEDGLQVMAERFRLEQVIVNLLQNALEALDGEADPRIKLVMSQVEKPGRGTQVRLTVSDNGPGMSPDAAASVFTPFATTKPRGLGLGLVISRDIVAEFGGELSFEPSSSEESRPGASFVITLPKAG